MPLRFSIRLLCVLALAWLAAAATSRALVQRPASSVTVTGSVVDDALRPLEGVSVTLEQHARVVSTTTTDTAGVFTFKNVPPGSYRLRATQTGFTSISRDVAVPASATTTRVPLVLIRQGVQTTAPAAIEQAPGDSAARRDEAVTSSLPVPQAANVEPNGRAGAIVNRLPSRDNNTTPPLGPGSASMTTPEAAWHPGGFQSGERYGRFAPNRFQPTVDRPVSTFGADVDTASYTNVRRFLSHGQLPPSEAVRVEEFVNYFSFPYPEPTGRHPLSLTTEIADCPWAPDHKLVLVGAKARAAVDREIEGRNIVLLVDVSGSMAPAERLPMLKTAFSMFADTLRPDDRLAIVTYAGWSGIALPPTPARHREVIQSAIGRLNAGGSTNGGQGLLLAYRLARESFVPGGVNRVVLATDGDFNVGITSRRDLLALIERERASGVFLSVLGVGSGNLNDATMEMLADNGNGHYAYLDSLQEARRVLVREGSSTLETVAKDVKFQVAFNPDIVAAWKLIGYENRVMPTEQFDDDEKDGGDLGAGHSVTMLYEVIKRPEVIRRPGLRDDRGDPVSSGDPVSFGEQVSFASGEWLIVKARYKQPAGDESRLLTHRARTGGRVRYLPFASAVAEFGLLLRDRDDNAHRWNALARRVRSLPLPSSLAADRDGFVDLVEIAAAMTRN